MGKTVLTLDEINLLKNSEELKDTNLYGNLYDCILKLQNPKATSLESIPNLDDLGRAALTINKKTLIDNVIKEWYAEKVSEEDPNKKVHCGLCNTPNKYLYYIRNRKNQTLLNVGSRCILKFPGLEGYIEKKQQLNEILKGHQIVNRRNEFYAKFPSVENTISESEKYFSTLPILLPYKLYCDLQSTIEKMRQIYSKYVQEGKKPFESKLTSFELFQSELEHYHSYQDAANRFIKEHITDRLICKRPEIDWLIANKKLKLLQQIAENNGVYTETTLRGITPLSFIKKYTRSIFDRNISQTLHFTQVKEASIYIQFKKFGYNPSLTFRISLDEFMDKIGAKCIIDRKIQYNLEDYLQYIVILNTSSNINSIMNYIADYLQRTPYLFLYDTKRQDLFLYRKEDKAIRNFKIESFINAYSSHILDEDSKLKEYVLDIAYKKNAQWISQKEQGKQGTDDIIRALYKQQKESSIY